MDPVSIGRIFAGIAGSLHIAFFYLESVAFGSNKGVQKLFLGRRAENTESVEVVRVPLLNQGFYNLFLAAGTLFGLYSGDIALVRYTLAFYVGAGLVLFASSPGKLRAAILQALPAAIGLYLLR